VATQNISITICVGDQFGRRTVIASAGTDKKSNRLWLCRCECGYESAVQEFKLAAGKSFQCLACARKHCNGTITHGETRGYRRTPEHKTWASMIQRCNPNKSKDDPDYSLYAGRGISVCERWRLSFVDFLADMGRRPSPDHSIDRIDNK
jgi:hypothetical protein